MVVVGLDRDRALLELARLAPRADAPGLARTRAATVDLAPAGAAEAIVAGLARPPRTFGPARPEG